MPDTRNELRLEGVEDPQELRRRAAIRDNRLRELEAEIARLELVADEADAGRAAAEARAMALEREAGELRGRLREYEEAERARRSQRAARNREIERLQRLVERRDEEIARLKAIQERREEELSELEEEAREEMLRRDRAAEDALRRIEGLEHDLEERESEVSELQGVIEGLQERLEQEHDLRRRLAEPANRLRAGIELFNESEHLESVNSVSRSLGQPEVHVGLEDDEEPAVLLTFTWRGITWRTYVSNPGLEVEEPRVYLLDSGENLSGVETEPPNSHVVAGGRVVLGL